MIREDDLDGRLRADNPFVWLGSRFIGDARRRAEVVLLHAFKEELRRIADTVGDPAMAALRFAWWAELIDRADGTPTGHPVADPLVAGVRGGTFDPGLLNRVIDDESGEPPPPGYTPPLLGSVVRVLDPRHPLESLVPIATAWALGTRLRSAVVERAVEAREGLAPSPTRLEAEAAFSEVWPEAVAASRALGPDAFPTVCHVTLAAHWARGGGDNILMDRWRLMCAVARGSL